MRSSRGSVLSDKDRGVALSPEQPVELTTAGNCRKLVVALQRSALDRTLSDVLGRRADELLVFSESMDAVDSAGAAWWRMVKHYFAESERAREFYGCSYFSQPIETALLRGLLISQPSNYSEQIKQALGTKIPEYVARARKFIEANYTETIHLEDIEAAAGVSRLKLFKSFRKHTGFTPAAYLKDYRLREARAQLQLDRCDRNVSSIALGVGFNHLGRFAIDYKLAFSETPSETIRRNMRSS
jgi:AraC-like DNA-binding protein